MNYTMSVEQIKEAIRDRLAHTFAVLPGKRHR